MRTSGRTSVLTGLVALALLLAACTGAGSQPTGGPGPLTGTIFGASLATFDACDDLVDWMQAAANDLVGPYGLGSHGEIMLDLDVAETADDSDGGAQRAAGSVAGVDHSGTNVQEAGIDEPDIVKTDGDRLLLVAQGRLHVLHVAGGQAPQLISSTDLPEGWGHELLLDGDRLLVTSVAHREGPLREDEEPDADADEPVERILPGYWSQPVTVFTLLDLAGDAPRVVETLEVEGHALTSRMIDGVARVVVRSDPGPMPFVHPAAMGQRAERAAANHNREVVAATTSDDWLPAYTHTAADGTAESGALVDCRAVHHPPEFAGLGTITVLSLPLAGPLTTAGATAVTAAGETVYASHDRLYVATNRWVDWAALQSDDPAAEAETVTTELHAFDITDERTARYVASGQVRGHVLNQWALSEHGGVLRVATTEGAAWWGWRSDPQEVSESFVTTFREDGGALAQVGQVGGLGLDERIYAVRFMGEIAYVVTFRETDPLYTVDLSDPADPRVLGELKIPGYSAYLHPVGPGLLLGVGQDADEQGMRLGMQVSLFDVSDLTDPRRLHTYTLEGAGTAAEYDHRAFLHWPATGLTVLPWSRWSWDEQTQTESLDSAATALTASPADGFAELGRVTHLPAGFAERPLDGRGHDLFWRAQIHRSLVVGPTLYTVSELGVKASDLGTLTERGWVQLPQDAAGQ